MLVQVLSYPRYHRAALEVTKGDMDELMRGLIEYMAWLQERATQQGARVSHWMARHEKASVLLHRLQHLQDEAREQ